MPGASRTPVKERRRLASRSLLRSPDATRRPDAKRQQEWHLVDGVWRDALPFNGHDAWVAEEAKKAKQKAEVEAWEEQQAESAGLVKACRA